MFDPDQPRDERGRWTDTGGSSGGMLAFKDIDGKIQKAASDLDRDLTREEQIHFDTQFTNAGIKRGVVGIEWLNPVQSESILTALEETPWLKGNPLTELTVVPFVPNASWAAAYDTELHDLVINNARFKNFSYNESNSYESQLAAIDSRIMENEGRMLRKDIPVDKKELQSEIIAYEFQRAMLEKRIARGDKAKPHSVASTIKDKFERYKTIMHHELGHHLEFVKNVNYEFDKSKVVSEYGASSKSEYFAEWYAHYKMKGEAGVPDDLLKIFKQ